MSEPYAPTAAEVAAYAERMLASLHELTLSVYGLDALARHVEVARTIAARPVAPPGGRRSSPASVARDIGDDLAVLAARAELHGMPMLAYLIGVASEEAASRARDAADQPPSTPPRPR
jgi:hypothetical protein